MFANELFKKTIYACSVVFVPISAEAQVGGFEQEAFKSLGIFPIIQAVVAIVILSGAFWAITRAVKDKSNGNGPGQNGMPQWVFTGPIHDAIGETFRISEQSRKQIDLLERILERGEERLREQRAQTQILEDMRNTVVMFGATPQNPRPPIPRRR